jgi:hypothetical protein
MLTYSIMVGGFALLAGMLAAGNGAITGRRWVGAMATATAWFALCLAVLR